MNTQHFLSALAALAAIGLVGCQSAPTRLPAPPPQPQLISAAPLTIEDSCQVDGAVLVEYTVLRLDGLGVRDLTSGYKWNLFVFCLALLPIVLLGLLACCIGVVVSMAVVVMSMALVYRFLQAQKAQPVAAVATVTP